MERSLVENVRRGMADVNFCVVWSTLEPDLRDRVEWRRVPAPRRPVLLTFAAFYLLGALQVVRAGPGLRQSTGAIVPNRAEIARHPLLSCRISGEGRKDRGAILVGNQRGARMAGPQGFGVGGTMELPRTSA
jgi:hypothetical protein